MIDIWFKRLYEDAEPMLNAYGDDAGWDLTVYEKIRIYPGIGMDVKSGIAVAIPTGYYGRIVGRSSALRKKGVLVVEGIIDAGFRGELFSYVYNPGVEAVDLEAGDSVAQLIVQPVPQIRWVESIELPDSVRGERGFGSSGR